MMSRAEPVGEIADLYNLALRNVGSIPTHDDHFLDSSVIFLGWFKTSLVSCSFCTGCSHKGRAQIIRQLVLRLAHEVRDFAPTLAHLWGEGEFFLLIVFSGDCIDAIS